MSDLSTRHPDPSSPAPAESGARVRVVLVGETGLDRALETERGIETVRARSAIEAVGEVAAPATPALRTVLVVGADAEPNGALPAFLDAVRKADPEVRVARAGDDTRTTDAPGYDGVVSAASAAGAVRRLAGLETAERASGDAEMKPIADPINEPRPEVMPEAVAEPKPVTDPERGALPVPPIEPVTSPAADTPVSRAGGPDAVGDAALLGLLDGPRSRLLATAVGLIAERVGADNVVFLDREASDEETAPVPSVPVSGGGRRLGAIRAASVPAERLVPHASWLGSWLALHDRQHALRRAAFTDPLTGAWNRRYFDGFLQAALDRARDTRRTVTVLVFDIDEFKRYNDDFGHPAGDEILIEVVRALKGSVRPSDRVCRIGGDEFAVVFDDPAGPRVRGSRPPESVYVLAKRVQRQIGEKKFPKLGDDAPGALTISGGLAAFPWDGHDAETLLDKADQLALESKKLGKNAITLGPGAERVCKHDGDDLLT